MQKGIQSNPELEHIARQIIGTGLDKPTIMGRLTVIAGMVMRTILSEDQFDAALALHSSLLAAAPENPPDGLVAEISSKH